MRSGIVLAMGAFGALGWVGYKQMPKTASANESPAGEEFVLDGETAESPAAKLFSRDVVEPAPTTRSSAELRQHQASIAHDRHAQQNPFSTNESQPVQTADASQEIAASPFERPRPSRRQAAAAPEAQPTTKAEAANPFAAFATPKSATVETTTEVTFESKSPRRKSPVRPQDDIVTLASNETAPHSSQPAAFADVVTQSEPATIDLQSAQAEPSEPAATQPPTAADDPFAAFATQPTEPAGAAPSSVPAAFGSA
ncbi:MAG TPA: hypothetical protein VM510_06125 [Caulifigura sp.]|nr:hypothetical protein [Caulifigura sp.]